MSTFYTTLSIYNALSTTHLSMTHQSFLTDGVPLLRGRSCTLVPGIVIATRKACLGLRTCSLAYQQSHYWNYGAVPRISRIHHLLENYFTVDIYIQQHLQHSQRHPSPTLSTMPATKSVKMITPFDGFKITRPAAVALLAYIILVVIVMLPFDMYSYDEQKKAYVKFQYSLAQRIILVILLIFPFLLGVYSVNCMMVGGCTLWSWIIALATIIWSILIVVSTIATKSFHLEDIVA